MVRLVRRRRAGRNGRLRIRRAEDRLQAAEQGRHARQARRTRLEQGDQQHEFRQLESPWFGPVITTRSQFEPTDHSSVGFLRLRLGAAMGTAKDAKDAKMTREREL